MEAVTIRQPLNDTLNMGPQCLQNFREDLWVEENRAAQPISSPFMLTNSLDEEVKRVRSCSLRFGQTLMMAQLEAAYINLPYDEDEEESQLPPSPLTNVSDAVTTPPLSPCTPFSESIDSPLHFPVSPGDRFLFTLPLSLGFHKTISPYEIFSPLPRVDDLVSDTTMGELLVPPATPIVPIQSLPELTLANVCPDATLPTSPSPPLSPPQSPPVAGSSRSTPKRSRWSKDDSDDESDEFTPQTRKATRPEKRLKGGSLKRTSPKSEGRGTKCDLCGKRLGRITDLPRHKASCKENPDREIRKIPCEFCEKLLPGTF
jgi:hypothetical protein